MTLAIAYQGEGFAHLLTDSCVIEGDSWETLTAIVSRPKVLWGNHRRLTYAISGTWPRRISPPRVLPQGSGAAAAYLGQWLSSGNDRAHVLTAGSPHGEPPTVHRVVIGSEASATTAQPGDVLFAGALLDKARQMGMEKNLGCLTAEDSKWLLAGFASWLFLDVQRATQQANNGSVPTVSPPFNVSTITATDSTEQRIYLNDSQRVLG